MPLSLVLVSTLLAQAVSAPDPAAYAGSWNLRITDASDTFVSGGFQITMKGGVLSAGLVWRSGSYLPAKSVAVKDGVLHLVREEEPSRLDVFEARLEGERLTGQVTYPDGKIHHFEGKKAPRLLDKRAPVWGEPVTLFDGKTLARLEAARREEEERLGGRERRARGGRAKDNADFVTEQVFQDLKLHLEFNVPDHGNSGVYLRGRYEIQIESNDPESEARRREVRLPVQPRRAEARRNETRGRVADLRHHLRGPPAHGVVERPGDREHGRGRHHRRRPRSLRGRARAR